MAKKENDIQNNQKSQNSKKSQNTQIFNSFYELNKRNNRKIGAYEENIATKYLSDNGYKILEKNFFTKIGEIDIIAIDKDDFLCFIEVKYRKSKNFGEGLEAVDKKKQRRIYNSARIYMCLNNIKEDRKCRFDVVSILDDKITLIKNAFP